MTSSVDLERRPGYEGDLAHAGAVRAPEVLDPQPGTEVQGHVLARHRAVIDADVGAGSAPDHEPTGRRKGVDGRRPLADDEQRERGLRAAGVVAQGQTVGLVLRRHATTEGSAFRTGSKPIRP